MVALAVGTIVLVPFPFSDLTKSKLRPAVVLAMVDKEDVILSQITSNPYTDIQAIELSDTDFSKGSLQRISFVRPGKLFTAHSSLIVSHVGNLKKEKFNFIIDEIVKIFRRNNL